MGSYSKKKWLGGRIYVSNGVRAYHIYRMINGKRYSVSTRCSTEQAALKELERWERDPDAYRPGGDEALVLTGKLIDAFVADGERKGNGPGRIWKKRHYMEWWQVKLGDRDLKKVSLLQLGGMLDGLSDRGNPTNVIKAFWSFLLETGRADTNPTERLKVPAQRPAQLTKSKVIPESDHRAVLAAIDPKWGDLMTVLAGTGWHISELERFASGGGEVKLVGHGGLLEEGMNEKRLEEGTVFVLSTSHKSGDFHQTGVGPAVGLAAKRVLKRGAFNKTLFGRAVRKAIAALNSKVSEGGRKIEPFQPGQYRHTIATNAIERGVAPEAVSAFLGHKSSATTKKFYAVHAIRPKIPTLA